MAARKKRTTKKKRQPRKKKRLRDVTQTLGANRGSRRLMKKLGYTE